MSSSLAGSRAAVHADPQPHHRVGEAVSFLLRDYQIHVFEPRQVVLGRAGRAPQAQRNFGQRQRFFLGEHIKDRLQRAVAAGAVEPELVRETAGGGDRS